MEINKEVKKTLENFLNNEDVERSTKITKIEKQIENLQNEIGKINGISEETKELTTKTKSLIEDIVLYSEIVPMSFALKKTINFAKNNDKEIDVFDLAEIMTGSLVYLEKKGFIKIIEIAERNK